MPELPEVEVVRRGLQTQVARRTLESVRIHERRLRWPVQTGLEDQLHGSELQSIGRRGKYLLLQFEHGFLISHLGMSGSWRFVDRLEPRRLHDHIDLVFGHGVLRYHDPRRFGSLHWQPGGLEDALAHPLLASLGVEPLTDAFDAQLLYERTRGRKTAIKQVLLSGQIVVGVGNIYACETLFRSGISPTAPAGRISRPRFARLAAEIKATLAQAIERGGSTLRDFTGSSGEQGYFQLEACVYDRAGQPCRRCGTPIRVIRQQQRATYHCRVCQR